MAATDKVMDNRPAHTVSNHQWHQIGSKFLKKWEYCTYLPFSFPRRHTVSPKSS